MGIARRHFDNILNGIFTEGNTIKLFSKVPDEQTESGGVNINHTPYKIQSGDFSVASGVVTSAKNMMFYLCETTGGDGTATGFGVYGTSGSMLYFGSFKEPMEIGYNTVPTIKKYDASKGEGVRITMTSTEVEASATSV